MGASVPARAQTLAAILLLFAAAPTAAEAVWRLPATTVHAVLLDFYTTGMAFEDPNVDPDPLTPFYGTRRNNPRFLPRRLLLRLHPSGRPDLASPRCPAP